MLQVVVCLSVQATAQTTARAAKNADCDHQCRRAVAVNVGADWLMSDQAPGERPRHDNGPSASAAESRVDASRAVLAASADGVVVIGGGEAIRFGNQATADLLAVPARELIGSTLGFKLVAGRPAEMELTGPRGDQRILDVRTSATKLNRELVMIAVLRDVTERKHSENTLEATLRQHLG